MDGAARKLVIIAPNWLGDAVMSLGAVAEARRAGVSVAVMSRPYAARVYLGVGGIDEVMVPEGHARSRRVIAQARALRACAATAVAVMPPSFSSALAPWLARVAVRVGYDTERRGALLTAALPLPPRGNEHLSESYRRLVRHALGLRRAGPAEPAPALRVFDGDREEWEALRERLGVGGDYAVIVPGAAYGPAKSWPSERFRMLARQLGNDLPVLVAGAGRERGLCERVAAGVPGAWNVAGSTTLGGFFALAAGARVLVANDSGTPHAAAALGVPVVVLFGSTSPGWTRPLGGSVTVLRHPVHCSPCFRRDCPTRLECFAGIGVDDVYAAARTAAAVKKGVA